MCVVKKHCVFALFIMLSAGFAYGMENNEAQSTTVQTYTPNSSWAERMSYGWLPTVIFPQFEYRLLEDKEKIAACLAGVTLPEALPLGAISDVVEVQSYELVQGSDVPAVRVLLCYRAGWPVYNIVQ